MLLGREAEGEDLLSRLSRVNPHNAHRDIERMLRPRCASTLPPIYDADLPLWDASRSEPIETTQPFNLIHEWMDSSSVSNRDQWVVHTPEVTQQLEQWKGRVECSEEGPPVSAINIWGDTAPFHTGEDSVLLLLRGCMAPALRMRWWITLLTKSRICQCGCNGRHTLDRTWKIVVVPQGSDCWCLSIHRP